MKTKNLFMEKKQTTTKGYWIDHVVEKLFRRFSLFGDKEFFDKKDFPIVKLLEDNYETMKKEFDEHRKNGTAHYLIKREGIDAVPFMHEDIDKWRTNFTGIQFHHAQTDMLVFGAVDDIWIDSKGNLMVVDYKASGAKEGELYEAYKRQMEVYQWLLRQNGFKVLPRGYFVYCRVNKEDGFNNGKLSFNIKVQPYDGDDSWVEDKIFEAKKVLSGSIPQASPNCIYCRYKDNSKKFE